LSRILAVAIDAPIRALFDYRAPRDVDPEALRPGMRLWVPFGRRRAVGVLVEHRASSEIAPERLRTVHSVIDDEPVLDTALLELLVWAADYYRHPVGEVLAAALPAPLRSGAPAAASVPSWSLTTAARLGELTPLSPRAQRLRELVALLDVRDRVPEPELAALSTRWRDHLRELKRRGWVTRTESRIAATLIDTAPLTAGPVLLEEQQRAVDAIVAGLGCYGQYVLRGVTGSGKTEVYLRAIEAAVRNRQQALVLVPEIALTPQLVERFAERFPPPLAVLHSALSDQERLRAWREARAGTAAVVVGTRSAIFAPLARPGLIVVDEEHDASFKQQEGFRYSARDLALLRAQRLGVPVILGSATPSLETLERLHSGRAVGLTLPRRATGAPPPVMRLVDLRRHAQTQGIATPTLLAIERHLQNGGQVLLYLNRRGYAPALLSPSCGWTASCPRCDARLTLHQREQRLQCHHCGHDEAAPSTCPTCGEPVKPVGQGTQRVEETLARLVPETAIVRIDRDATRRKGSLESAFERVRRGEARVLVGTQMLTKGHHFPDVSLVVVLNADHGLFGTDFRAAERLAQSIIQVAGRAGRAERAGEVLIQTEFPDHPLLAQLVDSGYDAFAAAALEERRQSGWPPFSRLAVLRAEATRREQPLEFLERARALAAGYAAAVELLGPAPAPMERRAGHFRAQLLAEATSHGPLQRLLGRWLPEIEALPESRRVRWSIDVDPLELF
jgi:primosomal protein N' (replication factor Y)